MNVSAHHIVPTRILFLPQLLVNPLTLFPIHSDHRNLRRADSSTLISILFALST
jgi:hypothetical protein